MISQFLFRFPFLPKLGIALSYKPHGGIINPLLEEIDFFPVSFEHIKLIPIPWFPKNVEEDNLTISIIWLVDEAKIVLNQLSRVKV
jgi:hypothetical protein